MELLSVNNLSQNFVAVPALTDVTFSIKAGEVLGVVGQRGAGKSTLFELLTGVYPPSSGGIKFNGEPVALRSVYYAQSLGIFAVQQQPKLVDTMDVLHNVFLGREICGPHWLKMFPDDGKMAQVARDFLEAFAMPASLVEEPVANLSGEQRQIVALARVLSQPCRLLLLDDALEALSFARQQVLLDRIRDLAAQGVAVIMSSDDLKHIFAVTDRILVLYQGRQVTLRRTSETTPREIVELIVGSNRQERVTPVIWAFENYYAAQQQTAELRLAQSELRQSLQEQDSLNRQLIERLDNQVKALDSLNLALQEASRRLITEREAERKALARELHDQVIQDLLSYNYQLEEVESETTTESQRLELAEIRDGIKQTVGSLRQICSALRPPTIDHHGLSAAIRSLSSQWSEQTGIQVELEIDPQLGRLPETIELSVFRIIQESLSNVRKHASATFVRLTLQRTSTASLMVRIVDNGLGMESPVDLAVLTKQKHFGLVGISERVSLLEGTLEVQTAQDGGFEIQIEIPSPYPSISD
ncbi:MAG: ATP-binding cassette domain-containing protein [Anaerolineae bacterium]|nr:ATP-binding cassette domain-containing protein [Anaerolineae bacterium]